MLLVLSGRELCAIFCETSVVQCVVRCAVWFECSEQQEALNALSVKLATQSAALAAREAALKNVESQATATVRGAEMRMGEVNIWKMEREEVS